MLLDPEIPSCFKRNERGQFFAHSAFCRLIPKILGGTWTIFEKITDFADKSVMKEGLKAGSAQIGILLLTFGLDQLTKANIGFFMRLGTLGPFFFSDKHNPGFILQTFSEVSPMVRIVFVCSLYGFLFFGYFFLEWFIPRKDFFLRSSISIFFGAITGNAFDRAATGAVSDFIVFKWASQIIYFNFADCMMWVGLAGICMQTLRNRADFEKNLSQRTRLLIDESYQVRSAFLTALIALSMMMILSVFGFTYMRSLGIPNSHAIVFFLSASALGLVFTAIAFIAGMLISHRSAGPLYSFERFVEALLRGENPDFKLRKEDEHSRLIEVARKLSERFHDKDANP